MSLRVDATRTRSDIRQMFDKWGIEQFSILREQEEYRSGVLKRGNGVTVSFFRKGAWQHIFCNKSDYDQNIRSVFFFLDRIRIAEKAGISYQGLSSTKDIVTSTTYEPQKEEREILEDAYDVLGVSQDDPDDLIKKVYNQKVQFYHPDHGGDPEKFKRITNAFETIMSSRVEKVGK